MVAAASIDRIVHVWSTQTHELLHRLDGHTESVYAVTFSQDGNRLVSGGLDKTIKVCLFTISMERPERTNWSRYDRFFVRYPFISAHDIFSGIVNGRHLVFHEKPTSVKLCSNYMPSSVLVAT